MSNWFIIDQLGEPFVNDEILGFWIEDGVPTMGVIMYGPVWFGEDEYGGLTDAGPDGWVLPGFFGIKRTDGTWQQEPEEIYPTHWMPLPDPPIARPKRPTIEDVIAGILP
jgi:hypothetical protein